VFGFEKRPAVCETQCVLTRNSVLSSLDFTHLGRQPFTQSMQSIVQKDIRTFGLVTMISHTQVVISSHKARKALCKRTHTPLAWSP